MLRLKAENLNPSFGSYIQGSDNYYKPNSPENIGLTRIERQFSRACNTLWIEKILIISASKVLNGQIRRRSTDTDNRYLESGTREMEPEIAYQLDWPLMQFPPIPAEHKLAVHFAEHFNDVFKRLVQDP